MPAPNTRVAEKTAKRHRGILHQFQKICSRYQEIAPLLTAALCRSPKLSVVQSVMDPVGQESTQAPHSMQESGSSISATVAPSTISSSGQVSIQEPQAVHVPSSMRIAIFLPFGLFPVTNNTVSDVELHIVLVKLYAKSRKESSSLAKACI
jgi:hypothetical protein